MQTRLFFLYPNTATAAIFGNYSPYLILFYIASVCAIVSFLLVIYFDTKQKVAQSLCCFVLSAVFVIAAGIFSDIAFPTEPKINSMASTSIIPTRLIICNKDVMNITGCTDSTASRKLQQVKDAHAKKEHQEVTIKEYCLYYSLDYREICNFLKLLK